MPGSKFWLSHIHRRAVLQRLFLHFLAPVYQTHTGCFTACHNKLCLFRLPSPSAKGHDTGTDNKNGQYKQYEPQDSSLLKFHPKPSVHGFSIVRFLLLIQKDHGPALGKNTKKIKKGPLLVPLFIWSWTASFYPEPFFLYGIPGPGIYPASELSASGSCPGNTA